MHIEIMDGFHERIEFHVPAHAAGGMEILAHAFPQVERLAHIDDRAEAVFMQLDTGLVRHGAQVFADGCGNWHAEALPQRCASRKLFLTSPVLDCTMGQTGVFHLPERHPMAETQNQTPPTEPPVITPPPSTTPPPPSNP